MRPLHILATALSDSREPLLASVLVVVVTCAAGVALWFVS